MKKYFVKDIYYIHIAFYILRYIDSKNLINSCTCTVVKVMTDINLVQRKSSFHGNLFSLVGLKCISEFIMGEK